MDSVLIKFEFLNAASPAYAVAGCYKIASVVHHEAQALSSTRIVIYLLVFLSLLSALNCYY